MNTNIPMGPEKEPKIGLNIRFSAEEEIKTVEFVLSPEKSAFFIKNGYNPKLPKEIRLGTAYTHEEIERAVASEYNPDEFIASSAKLRTEWEQFEAKIIEIQNKIPESNRFQTLNIVLRRYGVWGSYKIPDNVHVYLYAHVGRPVETVVHESVHLIIEQFINKYNIPHCEKERIVDLILMTEFSFKPQEDSKKASYIDPLFHAYYPDVRSLCKEIEKSTPSL